jgi:hypothetical protein
VKYRDDDISRDTDLNLFKKFHEVYKKHNEIHTIAVVARDLWKNRELTWYLEIEPLLDIQYHGLDHVDYSKMSIEQCRQELLEGVEYLESKLHRPIRVFYPPWNIEDKMVREVCAEMGLEYNNSRIEARDYLKGGMGERVNLHYWQDQEIIDEILSKDDKSNARKKFHEFINMFIPLVKKDGRILHIGKTHVYDYRAYFPWAEFIELDNDPILEPDILGSIEKVPASKKFDGILCFGVFEYLKDRVSAVHEIYRLLNKGGYALIGIPANIKPHDATSEIKRKFNIIYNCLTEEEDMETFSNNSEFYHHYLVQK